MKMCHFASEITIYYLFSQFIIHDLKHLQRERVHNFFSCSVMHAYTFSVFLYTLNAHLFPFLYPLHPELAQGAPFIIYKPLKRSFSIFHMIRFFVVCRTEKFFHLSDMRRGILLGEIYGGNKF